jgi:hypothetical protein
MQDGLSQISAPQLASKAALLALLIVLSLPAHAQKSVAVSELRPLQEGVTLPVRLNHSLEAGKTKPKTKVVVTTTQRVPIGEQAYLHHGARLHGEVVTSIQGDGTPAHPSVLSIRFTSLQYKHQTVPISTRAIAIANFVQVDQTTFPANGGSDRGNNSPASWTTNQVGGGVIDRSGWIGDLDDGGLNKVGSANYFGVYTLPLAPASGDGPAFPRALGVFSASASGLYGIEVGTTLRSDEGTITLTRPARKLLLRVGDNRLLEVVDLRQRVPQPRQQASTH